MAHNGTKREQLWGVGLALAPIAGFVIFGIIPMALAVAMAFMNIRGFSFTGAQWAGLDNFRTVFTDVKFYKSVGNTFYAALSMPVSLVLALIVAVLLNQKLRFKKIFRTIFFIPYVCSVVAVTIMWKWVFDGNYGILNDIITRMGGERVLWLTQAKTFMPAMIIMGVWSGTGFGIILYSAALTAVNPAYYEAAQIDGAGRFKQFWHVTLPSVSPTTFYLFIMGLIGALQEFARFQVMDVNGGPGEAGLTIVFYLYRTGFNYYKMGVASAVAWILAVMILLITLLNFKLSSKWVHYD